jgi:hypothetical protein
LRDGAGYLLSSDRCTSSERWCEALLHKSNSHHTVTMADVVRRKRRFIRQPPGILLVVALLATCTTHASVSPRKDAFMIPDNDSYSNRGTAVSDYSSDYKSKKEWWKDPLSLFEDDEEEYVDEATPEIPRKRAPIEEIPEEKEEEMQEPERYQFRKRQEETPNEEEEEGDVEIFSIFGKRNQEKKEEELEEEEEAPPQWKRDKKTSTLQRKEEQPQNHLALPSLMAAFTAAKLQNISLGNVPFLQLAGLAVISKAFVEWIVGKVGNDRFPQLQAFLNKPKVAKKPEEPQTQEQSEEEENVNDDGEGTTCDQDEETKGASSSPKGFSLFGKRSSQIAEKLSELETQCQSLEGQKTVMEREYEQASSQLQESQSELSRLKQTTEYLQAQLRDNEELTQRAIKSERTKAKDELVRMKEAMIKIVEREREAMREEFIQQADELETLWSQQNQKKN